MGRVLKGVLTGKDEVQQLRYIFQLCGTPTAKTWPGHQKLPRWNLLTPTILKRRRVLQRRVRDVFASVPEPALDLLDRLLTLNPDKRISVHQALNHRFFYPDTGEPVKKHNECVLCSCRCMQVASGC